MGHYHHNLEPSGFRKGEYVGYAAGAVFRITRTHGAGRSDRTWWAQYSNGARCHIVGTYAASLADMSAKLAKIAAEMERK